MKALLLSAGLGTRLRPITNFVPKCLVPINGKPLLEYWFESLSQIGVDEFLVNTHYLHKQVQAYLEQSQFKDKVKLTYEPELLLTGGTLLANKDFFNDNKPFMVIHADNLCFCDFEAFLNAHKDRPDNCIMTMMTFYTDNPKKCGIVEINENKVVTSFYEKVDNPPSNLANGAVYIFEPEIFDVLSQFKSDKIDFSIEVMPLLIGRINTFLNDIYLKDIGDIPSYALAQIEVLDFVDSIKKKV
ncbi:nucleotidyltransferase family protein [Arcobacter sp. FWKO B]|uniref:nucleotidyltransferase family protein n=1 Tax=Arcobacter sp. FWKO B TaxID=2593672 RepID=UPI0018A3E932|nr:nucleotidyltransferase family protein [Arcobacter sp. FWKO B]QOG12170.1 nucleotidyltransferase family protein [Arcobacter sp. FWKO B]